MIWGNEGEQEATNSGGQWRTWRKRYLESSLKEITVEDKSYGDNQEDLCYFGLYLSHTALSQSTLYISTVPFINSALLNPARGVNRYYTSAWRVPGSLRVQFSSVCEWCALSCLFQPIYWTSVQSVALTKSLPLITHVQLGTHTGSCTPACASAKTNTH